MPLHSFLYFKIFLRRNKKWVKRYRIAVLVILSGLLYCQPGFCQAFIFAQLQGTPVNTAGWNLTGSARVGNIKNTDNSEIILCDTHNSETGSAFFNQPINLSKCNKWKAEFDFRIFDGTAADGIAFCFLDVPPTSFVSGEGVGIPATSNGLKVVFDTYNNCSDNHSFAVPKIELRWGTGYGECSSQPTLDNSNGALSFIRSDNYNHATITYDAGNITVSVNNKLYLTGFQQLNLSGYLGFTSGTGGNYDNHSIKNVVIYTNVPSFDAGTDKRICAGQTVEIGSQANTDYTYQWSPAEGLNSSTIANPTVDIPNTTNADITRTYYVQTSLSDSSGCTSTDSVAVTISTLFPPSVSIAASASRICGNSPVTFTATAIAGGDSPLYQWLVNGNEAGINSDTFTINTLSNGDTVSCLLTNKESCAAVNSAVSNAISLPRFSLPTVDAGAFVSIDYGSDFQLNAVTTGTINNVVWSPASGLSNNRILNPVASPVATTLYTVSVQSKDACLASDTVTVKVISKGVVIPTAFTPDNDGKNEVFKPIVLGTAIDYLFVVFNRWGQKLFESKIAGKGWDGAFNGQLQSAGTYIWTLSCTLDTNQQIQKKGTVVLIR